MIGGIGVMNINARIGYDGQKRSAFERLSGNAGRILSQFLIEAVILTAIGGSIGVGIGEVLSIVINSTRRCLHLFPSGRLFLGLFASAGVGLSLAYFLRAKRQI